MKGKQYSLNGLLVRKLLMSELATHRTGGKKPQSWTSLQSTPETPPHLGKDERSLSRYSPRAFWIFPSRSANLSRDLCTPWMFRTSITRGDLDTFFIRAKNSVLMLQVKSEARLLSAFMQCSQPSPPFCPHPLEAEPLEPLGLHRQQVLDVCTAREDALQVDPAPLHVDPHVEQGHDAVQLVFPAQGILLKHLWAKGAEVNCYPSPLSDTPELTPRRRQASNLVM